MFPAAAAICRLTRSECPTWSAGRDRVALGDSKHSDRGSLRAACCRGATRSPDASTSCVIDSELLRDNPLGDPHERPLWVYVPPGYDDTDRRYPSVYVLQGYTGHARRCGATARRSASRSPRSPTSRSPPARSRRASSSTSTPGRRYGGSQFVDSPGTGRYHSYLCDEVVPFVDARYRTLAAPQHRGVAGKSSGGFGAFITPMLRPDLFGGLASHAGDSLYEYCYIPEFAKIVRTLRDQLRRLLRAVLGGLPLAPGDEQGGRRHARDDVRLRRVLLRRGRRHRDDCPSTSTPAS